ncbi:MAG: hypothetical protein ABWZ56_05500 [Flavobacterium sp.]
MKSKKLNLEDFKENQLTRIQTTNIRGCAPVPPPPPLIEVDEDGNPIKTSNNGDPGQP